MKILHVFESVALSKSMSHDLNGDYIGISQGIQGRAWDIIIIHFIPESEIQRKAVEHLRCRIWNKKTGHFILKDDLSDKK